MRHRGNKAALRRGWRGLRPWAALAALLVQFVAAFGHVHPEDFAALKRPVATSVAAVAGVTRDAPERPAERPAPLPTHDDCAICAVQHMLGGASLPEPPGLAAPVERGAASAPCLAAFHLTPAQRLLFETRGPPRA